MFGAVCCDPGELYSLSLSSSAIRWQSRSQTVLCKSPPPLRPSHSGYSRPHVDLLCVLKLDYIKSVMEIKWQSPEIHGGISQFFFLVSPFIILIGLAQWNGKQCGMCMMIFSCALESNSLTYSLFWILGWLESSHRFYLKSILLCQ